MLTQMHHFSTSNKTTMEPNKHTHGKMTKRLYLPKTIDKINIKYYERNLLKKIANEPMYFKLFFPVDMANIRLVDSFISNIIGHDCCIFFPCFCLFKGIKHSTQRISQHIIYILM